MRTRGYILKFQGDTVVRLIQGDCLEEMKNIEDNSIDMVLTDPPYGMSFQSNYRNVKHKTIDNDSSLEWVEGFAKQCYRVAKNNTAHYVFCSWHFMDVFKQAFEKHFKIKNMLVWVKNNTGMGDLKGNFAPKHELILFMHKGRKLYNGKRVPNILEYSKTSNKLHPTEKPVDMLEFMLAKFSGEGDLVLDPFMGSGSTGVACVNTNRNFIGIELDEGYFNIAKERIETL